MQEIQNLTSFWSSVHAQFKISFYYYSTKGAHLIRWIWKRWHSRSLQKLFSYTIPWEYLKGLWGHSFKNVTAAQKSKKEISELLSKYFSTNCSTFWSICLPFWVGSTLSHDQSISSIMTAKAVVDSLSLWVSLSYQFGEARNCNGWHSKKTFRPLLLLLQPLHHLWDVLESSVLVRTEEGF